MEIANDFLENVCTYACAFANHRKASAVDVQDVQLHLEKNWDILIPGYRADSVSTAQSAVLAGSASAQVGRLFRKPQTSYAHRDRMALVLHTKDKLAQMEKEKEKANSTQDKEKNESKDKDQKGDSKSSSSSQSSSSSLSTAANQRSSTAPNKKRKHGE